MQGWRSWRTTVTGAVLGALLLELAYTGKCRRRPRQGKERQGLLERKKRPAAFPGWWRRWRTGRR
jgi:hypothetical protein